MNEIEDREGGNLEELHKPRVPLGGPKSLFSFFLKIKHTFFIFTNNFIDLHVLSMLAMSLYWLLGGRGQGCC